ncbi:acyltransferase family protein [Jeotgalibacillus proteolyticus]|uniref:Acyltransferase 3 domain-containing protein n=1 Tax=Jeotgalibacillus proteolyticus TaxID=2082395 RepID=A0A2S5G8L6_9BACL|nr:acyltransferase [Jeotgalibacillus proteolyticus]PPA69340.1 hypothetical protein C4B60_16210 [Jeotgalibacillus proteolyticus]
MGKAQANFRRVNGLLDGNVSVILDFIRGISAILVVMEHLSSRLFVGYGNVEAPSMFVQALYLLNILGGPSVIIFFVLSGVFISRSVLKAVYEDKWSWKSYLINRCARLMTVLVPALMLTFILDSIAGAYFGYSTYESLYQNAIAFLGNLFFLQNITVGVYGSNAPLWSLNYEFWYYMLFPLLFLLFSRQGRVAKFIYIGIALFIILSIGTRMNSYFFVWLIGSAVLFLPGINLLKNRFVLILATLFLLGAMALRPLVMTGRFFTNGWTTDLFFVDLIVGIAFGFFVYTLMHSTSHAIKKMSFRSFSQFAKLLAGFSFSLYLIHYPIINTVYYWANQNGFTGLQPGAAAIGAEIVLVALICLAAYFFSRVTEAHTSTIRRFIAAKLTLKNRQPEMVIPKPKPKITG